MNEQLKTTTEHPQKPFSLIERFMAAYESIPNQLRPNFLEDFAKVTKVSEKTAKNKAYGSNAVTLWEVIWAEGYNPFERKSNHQGVPNE